MKVACRVLVFVLSFLGSWDYCLGHREQIVFQNENTVVVGYERRFSVWDIVGEKCIACLRVPNQDPFSTSWGEECAVDGHRGIIVHTRPQGIIDGVELAKDGSLLASVYHVVTKITPDLKQFVYAHDLEHLDVYWGNQGVRPILCAHAGCVLGIGCNVDTIYEHPIPRQTEERTVVQIDEVSGECLDVPLEQFGLPTQEIYDVDISFDKKFMLVNGYKNLVRLFDNRSQVCQEMHWSDRTQAVSHAFLSPSGSHVVTCGYSSDPKKPSYEHGQVLGIWNTETQAYDVGLRWSTINHRLEAFYWSENYKQFVRENVVVPLFGSGYGFSHIMKVLFSYDSKKIAFICHESNAFSVNLAYCTCQVFDLETARFLWELPIDQSWVHSAALSPDGSKVAFVSDRGVLRVVGANCGGIGLLMEQEV